MSVYFVNSFNNNLMLGIVMFVLYEQTEDSRLFSYLCQNFCQLALCNLSPFFSIIYI